MNWTDYSSNEMGFKIERKSGVAGTYIQIAAVASNLVTYQDIDPVSGTYIDVTALQSLKLSSSN